MAQPSLACQPLPSALRLLRNSRNAEGRGWRARLGATSAGNHNHTPFSRMALQADRTERHRMSLEEVERWREMRAEEREKDKLMLEGVLQKWLPGGMGAGLSGQRPPTL